MTSKYSQRPRAQFHRPIFTRFRPILVSTQHDDMPNGDRALLQIAFTDTECDLFRLTQPREEPKLVEVAHGLTPLGVDAENEDLRLLNGEGINWGAILLQDPKAVQSRGRVA
ncbi:MAG TPA: hypothetical protein VJQ47_16955 [Steroidobacteraceae bacterium]|nr:hypothetical protein [Steroidobacteraceae bacterium]